MGGPVSIVVREPLGEIKCYDAWTGGIPGICNCNRLYDDDPRLTDYLDCWYEGHTKEGVSPDGYGLVLIDRMKKVILTCQGYSSPGKIIGAGISNELRGLVVRMGDDDDDRGDALNFIEAFIGGRIKCIERWDRTARKRVQVDVSDFKSPQEVLDMFDDEDRPIMWDVILDTYPYTIEKFEEDSKGLMALKKRVLDLGFILSEVEEQQWKEYIDDRREWEEEDEDEDDFIDEDNQ